MDGVRGVVRRAQRVRRLQRLVMGADLGWRQVGILRAIGRYLRQAGSTYSQTYVAQALSANVDLARLLVALFETKFDPELDLEHDRPRRRRSTTCGDKIKTGAGRRWPASTTTGSSAPTWR